MSDRGRVCVLLMDSLGIGASLDAVNYGDEGANTRGSGGNLGKGGKAK